MYMCCVKWMQPVKDQTICVFTCLIISSLCCQKVVQTQYITLTAKMSSDFTSVIKEGHVKVKGKHFGVT